MTEKTPELQRLRDDAEVKYKAWRKASAGQKVVKWQQYEDAEAKYWRAVYDSKETQ